MGVCIKLNIRKGFLSTSRAAAPRRPIENRSDAQRIRARSAGSDSAKDLPCAATDGVHRSGSLENRLSCLQLLGTNLIYPRRQRFHDDDPAGKCKSGVVVGSGPLFFGGPVLFANFIRRHDPFKGSSSSVEGICMIFAFRLAGLAGVWNSRRRPPAVRKFALRHPSTRSKKTT
jgi:hypothetical protein